MSFLIKKNVDSHICVARKDLQLIYGVMGDIHSNYDALTAVAGELRQEHVDKILCVGADVHPKLKNKKAMKALIVLAFSLIGKFFSRDYSYVPTWQCLR